MKGFVSILCGTAFGLGIVGIAATWRSDPNGGQSNARRRLILTEVRRNAPLLLLAGLVGAAFVAVTGWPMALPIAAGAVYGLPKLFGRTSGSASIAKVEAVATWTEMLQGTLAASALGAGDHCNRCAQSRPDPKCHHPAFGAAHCRRAPT
jgi:tight adherence protein B